MNLTESLESRIVSAAFRVHGRLDYSMVTYLSSRIESKKETLLGYKSGARIALVKIAEAANLVAKILSQRRGFSKIVLVPNDNEK